MEESKERKAHFFRTVDGNEPAKNWLENLKDKLGRAKIMTRILRATNGNFGDHKSVGDGVSELRIAFGPGYRLYYGLDERGSLIILLMGGDKSTQEKDILKAKEFWKTYKSGDKL